MYMLHRFFAVCLFFHITPLVSGKAKTKNKLSDFELLWRIRHKWVIFRVKSWKMLSAGIVDSASQGGLKTG